MCQLENSQEFGSVNHQKKMYNIVGRKLLVTMVMFFVILSAAWAQDYQTEITVAKDGSGDFLTIQEAINVSKAFPDSPVKITVRSGVYNEKVHVYSWNTNLSIVGDKNGKTVISYDDHFKRIDLGRNSTFHTSTMKVEANDFYAANLTIQNTAGDVGQAIAIFVGGDRVAFENCQFLGNQDTMYLTGENFRQYFKNCLVTGSTDFIFGNATALFDACEIRSKKASYVTAASTVQTSDFGFVFIGCRLTNEDLAKVSTYLGRPWRNFAKTVFINCELGEHIHPEGWKEWNSDGSVLYAEYGNTGLGSNVSERVNWSQQLTKVEAMEYTISNIFRGWKPDASK